MRTKSRRRPAREREHQETEQTAARNSRRSPTESQAAPHQVTSTPEAVVAMQESLGNRAVLRLLAQRPGGLHRAARVSAVPPRHWIARAPVPEEPKEAAGPSPKEREDLAKEMSARLKGKEPKSESDAGAAVAKAIEASLKTGLGKKVIGKAARGRTRALTLGLAAGTRFATWLAGGTKKFSTPDIPLGKGVSVGAEYKGSPSKFKSIMLRLKVRF